MLGPSTLAWLAALSVGMPAPASAPPRVEIGWSAPERCPTASAVQQRLARALAESQVDPRGLRAQALVTEDDAHVLTLVLALDREDGPVGRRTMQASDCDELATAAVLIVALAVDPSAKLDATEDHEPDEDGDADVPLVPPPEPLEPEPLEPEPLEPEPLAPEPLEPETPAPEPASVAPDVLASPELTARQRRLHVGLQLGAGVGISVLPRTTAVVSAAALAWGRAWRAELGAQYWTPVERFPAGGSAGGRIQQWNVDARGCGLLRPGPLELPLCGGIDVGAVHGEGVGVASPNKVTSLRLALVAGAALAWRPRRWSQRFGPWIGADLLASLVRARFRATPAAPGLVYHTPAVGGRVAAGVELRFR